LFIRYYHDGYGIDPLGNISALSVSPGGSTSPLTTKGDLYTYSTTNARLAVGSNGTGLVGDSAETTGNRWTLQAIAGELLISDTPSTPLVFADILQTDTQDDL